MSLKLSPSDQITISPLCHHVLEMLVSRDASISIFVKKEQSGRLVRQPSDFPQRGKSAYPSARSIQPASKAYFPCPLASG